MTTVTGVPAGPSPAPYQPAATAQPRSADAARQPEAALRSEVTVPADAAASSPAGMLQGLVSIFGGNISQLDPSNITKESLRQAGVNMTESLFDLVDNGMKLADERSGAADGKISEEEISLFFNNVNTFRQMAQLPETDAEFARVARLYNKEGGDYTRISISDYQRIAEHITQQWEAAGSVDPYEKAAQVIGNGVQAAPISPMLDMISRKLNRADYKDAQPEGQKSVLSAFLLASSLRIDIEELYGEGSERPVGTRSVAGDHQEGSPVESDIQTPGISQEPDNTPALFTVGSTTVTQKMFAAALEDEEQEVTTETGVKRKLKDIPEDQKRKAVFSEIVLQLAAIEAAKHLVGQARAEDIKTVLSGKGIPEANINDELITMIRQTPLALEIVVGLIEAGKMSESDFNSQTQQMLAGAKFADTAEGQALNREIMGQRTGTGPAASVAPAAGPGRASGTPTIDEKVSDAFVLAMTVERSAELKPDNLQGLRDAVAQLNDDQFSAFVKKYKEMAENLGDQEPHCLPFFDGKNKGQAVEAMGAVLGSLQGETSNDSTAPPEAVPEEKAAEAVPEEQQTEEKPAAVPQQKGSQEEIVPESDPGVVPAEQEEAVPEEHKEVEAAPVPEAEAEEPERMGKIRQQLDTISKNFNEGWQSKTRQLERYYVALQEYIRELKADQYAFVSKECEERLSGLTADLSGSPLRELYFKLANAQDPAEANEMISSLIGDLRSA